MTSGQWAMGCPQMQRTLIRSGGWRKVEESELEGSRKEWKETGSKQAITCAFVNTQTRANGMAFSIAL